MARVLRAVLICGFAVVCWPAGANAVGTEPIGTFVKPTYLASDPGDPDRLLISQLDGQIELVDHGVRSTMLDLAPSGLLGSGGSYGLFSFALAPDFESSGHIYLFYTRAGTAAEPELEFDSQIDRFTVEGDTIDVASRRPVLAIPLDDALAHQGGQLQFGPDGMLWISLGDGSPGGNGDSLEAAQSLDDLRGKLLRVDPLPSGPTPYAIPADNPFAGAIPGAGEIWNYGFRNPWRFSFDRLTRDLWIGEVGEDAWEEAEHGPWPDLARGANFGWDCREGPDVFEPAGCSGPFTAAFFEFPHGPSEFAGITGGYVVRDPSLTDLYGRYLYGEIVFDDVRSVAVAGGAPTDDRLEFELDTPISFGEDACGRLYVLSLAGQVLRLVGDTPTDCSPPSDPPPVDPPTAPGPPLPACRGAAASVAGERGTKGADVIVGSADDGTLRGGGGDDLICGGGGDDRLLGGRGDDRLLGGRGDDTCAGGRGRDRLQSC